MEMPTNINHALIIKHQIRSISDRTNLGTQIVEDVLSEAVKQNAVQENPSDPLESEEFYELMRQYKIAPIARPHSVEQKLNDVKQWLRDNLL